MLGTKWNVTHLTFRISKYSKTLSRQEVDGAIARAFNVWSEHIDLTFTAASTDSVDIDISFEEGEHGDGLFNSFVLGHATNPMDGAYAHFNDAQSWKTNSLLHVAVHEFGHLLGLDHSTVLPSVMFPYSFGFFDPNNPLGSDDIRVSFHLLLLLYPVRY